jgi:hypothetical protein
MNLLIQSHVRVWLVSATLLAAWGCEDGGNFDGSQHLGQTPDVLPDGLPEASVPPPDLSPDVPASMDMDPAAPDAAPDAPIEAPDAADAGPEAPTRDAPDGAPDTVSDTSPEGPPNDGGDVFCPGARCPLAIAPGHLQLWLQGDDETEGDLEIDCPFDGPVARVREWRDRSGKDNHARPPIDQVGPLCGPSAGMINGKRVVTFPRTMPPKPGDPQVAEHLEVSLASIQGRPFTVAIVEKRKDAADFSSWMLGGWVDTPETDCAPHTEGANTGRVLQIGYAAAWDKRVTTWGHACGISLDETLLPGAGLPDPSAPTVTTLWLVTVTADDKLALHLNGTSRGESAGEGLKPPGEKQLTAYIGRGYQLANFDSRFKGDIAEILIYDDALDQQQRRTLEQHLQSRWGFVTAN